MNLNENIFRIKELIGILNEESDIEVFPKKNVAYHVTPDIYLNQIKQVGLIPKSESKISYHPERIYLFMAPDMDKQMANILWDTTKKETKNKIKNYYVLQIDLTKLPNHKFYNDSDTMISYIAIFTPDPIPSSAIKVVKKIPISEFKSGPTADEIKKDKDERRKKIEDFEKSSSSQRKEWDSFGGKLDDLEKMLKDQNLWK